jgi:hypothetical protein
MDFVGYKLKRSAPKGHYALFLAELANGQLLDKDTVEKIAQNAAGKVKECAEFIIEHWPQMSE